MEPIKSGRNVTIKDLSRELGLSITTISRALNGYSDVGEKTRLRVEAAAHKFGYRPNRHAQRLVTRRTHNIAWIQADNDRKFVDPHFVEVMAGVLRAARNVNHDVVLSSETPDRQIAVYDRHVSDNVADGFIIDLPEPNDPRITFLLEAGQPFVVHGRDRRAARYNWVDVDNYSNFYDLARVMVANGHKRIAFVNGDEHYAFAIERRKGAKAAIRDMGLPPDALTIHNAAHPMSGAGFMLTEQALADETVTALLYSSALMAVEGHAAIVRSGRTLCRDIAVGTMDDQLHYLDLSAFVGQFTFVRSSLRDAGMALVHKLIATLEGENVRPGGIIVPSLFQPAKGVDAAILGRPAPRRGMAAGQ